MATAFEFQSGQLEFKSGEGVADNSSPVFSGISSVTPQTDGSFLVTWAAATGTKTPIRYEIYVALGSVSAVALFLTANRVAFAPGLLTSWRITTLRDQVTYFVNGQIYTFGVRAIDAFSYTESNTVILTSTAIASGNLPTVLQTTATQLAATEVLLAADHVNFQGDHINFQTDHTNFQGDHTNFQTDHTNFGTDHTAFQSDHTAFGVDHTNFGTDHTNFVSDLATFNGYLTTFNGYLTTFNTLNSTYNTNNSTFTASLATLAADLATLATDLSTFSSQNVILTAQVTQLGVLVGLLSGSVSSQTGSAGLQMTFVQQVATMTMSVE